MSRTAIIVGITLGLAAPNAEAQWGDFLKDKVKQNVGRQIDQKTDEALRSRPAAPAQPAQPARAAEQPAGAKAAPVAAEKAAPAGVNAADEVAAGEVYGNKFDFVPGDVVLLFDDLAETEVGDYPARWTIKDGGGNPSEVVSYKGRKWWMSVPGKDGNDQSMHWLRYAPKADLPKKFTIEFDVDMGADFSVVFNQQQQWGGRELRFHKEKISSAHVATDVKPYGPVVKRISISVNGTYAKVYVGGARILQDPDAIERPVKRIGFRFDRLYRSRHDLLDHQMMTAFRLAEGGKDIAQALNTDGRIVVHGIYFDTGSDVIRPESGGALRGIQQILEGDPKLRFRIEGHTDDQGGPAVNGPLSDRRAASVKAWLIRQGIDAGRLEPKGFGATRPMDANTTQEGRANNRRVEFVRLPAPGA